MLRVYCRQWLPFYTSRSVGPPGRTECELAFDRLYRGRVTDEDWRIEATEQDYGRSFLMLQVPNCCGEYSSETDAVRRAGEHGTHPHQIAERGSRAERELLSYGTRRLRGE